jgi:hypothetical protein
MLMWEIPNHWGISTLREFHESAHIEKHTLTKHNRTKKCIIAGTPCWYTIDTTGTPLTQLVHKVYDISGGT